MEMDATITAAIHRFDMREPWLFQQTVAASLDAVNAKVFGEIWAEAIASKHWRQRDLAACAREASSALQQRFALEGDAADVVANAAAYVWK